MADTKHNCACWEPDKLACKKEGRFSCRNCFLVAYCGSECQKADWPEHKEACKSPLNSKTWKPAWAVENREPAFADKNHRPPTGLNKALWGAVPAIDMLKLRQNEGFNYDKKLSLLFAGDEDIRNVIKTVTDLPDNYKNTVEITMNNPDFEAAARNALMLIVAISGLHNKQKHIDLMIHIWYSAFIHVEAAPILQSIKNKIKAQCEEIKKHKATGPVQMTWEGINRQVDVVLDASDWPRMLSMLEVREGLTVEGAKDLRKKWVKHDSRKDYRDHLMYCLSPSRRLAFDEFREHGMLRPFHSSGLGFLIPNPTLFRYLEYWPMQDTADPLHGWSSADVAAFGSGSAPSDLYGNLYYYLHHIVTEFVDFLGMNSQTTFTMFNFHPDDLPLALEAWDHKFDRIHISNIGDPYPFGRDLNGTLRNYTPLLQNPEENPHATLIALFKHAVVQTMTEADAVCGDNPQDNEARRRMDAYFPVNPRTSNRWDPDLVKKSVAWGIVQPYHNVFNR